MSATMTKGEVLVSGLDQIKEGLQLISEVGDKYSLIHNLIGSQAAAKRLREVMASKTILYNLIANMVCARNSRLSEDTVNKVITDFLDILFDLSKPYSSTTLKPESEINATNRPGSIQP